jgi:hypothetical protein
MILFRRTENFKQDTGRGCGKLHCYDTAAVIVWTDHTQRETGSRPIAECSRYTERGELTIDPRGLRFAFYAGHASLIN